MKKILQFLFVTVLLLNVAIAQTQTKPAGAVAVGVNYFRVSGTDSVYAFIPGINLYYNVGVWPKINLKISGKVDKTQTVNGKALSGNITLTKADIGLSLVDNTADANKPVSGPQQTALNLKEDKANKGAANGYAALDASSKLLMANVPDALVGSVNYQGSYNATTNSPSLPTAVGNKGYYYVVSTAGTQQSLTFAVGDWIISNGTIWQKVDNNNAVTSVSGKIGAVTLVKADVGLNNADNTSDANKPVSTATQTALNLKEDLSNKSSSTALGTSSTLYPTQSAVKGYVDANAILITTNQTKNGRLTLTTPDGADGASPGTSVAPLIVQGGNGGTNTSPTGFAAGGTATTITVRGGAGGGSFSSTGAKIGGTGGGVELIGGDAGQAGTSGGTAGTAGSATLQAGSVGTGSTNPGFAGKAFVKGGQNSIAGGNGGSIYIVPGFGDNNSAVNNANLTYDGNIFLGVNDNGNKRGAVIIGSDVSDVTNNLQVTGNSKFNGNVLVTSTPTVPTAVVRKSDLDAAVSGLGNTYINNQNSVDQVANYKINGGGAYTNVSGATASIDANALLVTASSGVNKGVVSPTDISAFDGAVSTSITKTQLKFFRSTPLTNTINVLPNYTGLTGGQNLDITLPNASGTLALQSSVVATNLALGTRTTITVPVTNSNGTGFTLPIATTSLAGVMSSTDKTNSDASFSWGDHRLFGLGQSAVATDYNTIPSYSLYRNNALSTSNAPTAGVHSVWTTGTTADLSTTGIGGQLAIGYSNAGGNYSPAELYIRSKSSATTWDTWDQIATRDWASTTFAPISGAGYLPLSGGTLTGNLLGTTSSFSGNVNSQGAFVVNRAGAVTKGIFSQTSASNRWFYGANATSETGTNLGTNFVIERYSDAGASLGNALVIERNSGIVTITGALAGLSTANFTGNVIAATAPTIGAHLVNKTALDAAVADYLPLAAGSGSPLTGTLFINKNAAALSMKNTLGATGNVYAEYRNNADARLGYVGFGSAANNNMQLVSDLGNITYTGSSHVFNSQITGTTAVLTGNYTGNNALATGATGTNRGFYAQTGGVHRWSVVADSNPESGTNAGSNFSINRFDDSGTLLGSALSINRANGTATFSGIISGTSAAFTSTVAATTNVSVSDAAATTRGYFIRTGANNRWLLYGATDAESGSNSGTNFAIARYADAGTFLGNPLSINRATGAITVESTISAATAPTAGNHLTNKTYVDSRIPVVTRQTVSNNFGGSIAAGANVKATFSTVSIPAGVGVIIGLPTNCPDGLMFSGKISSSGDVEITAFNPTGTSITVPSMSLNLKYVD